MARGPIAFVRDGDSVTIDADHKSLTLNVSEAQLAKRRQGWVKPEIRVKRGVLAEYARTVGSASQAPVMG